MGNAISSAPIGLLPADTSKVLSVKATRGALSRLPTIPQPRLIRSGLTVVVRFDSSNKLDETSWYELSVGSQVRFSGLVTIGKTGIVVSDPSGVLLAGINSDLGVLKAQYTLLGTTKLDLTTYSNYSLTVANTLVALANNMAANAGVIGQKLAITDTVGFQRRASGHGLYPNADKTKLAGIAAGATNVDSTLLVRKSTYNANRTADQNAFTNHAGSVNNPHNTTAAQVGLGQVRNVASYSQSEVDAIKPDITTVTTFAIAKTLTIAGKPKVFIITSDESYGSSLTIWNGSSFSVLPLIPRSTN